MKGRINESEYVLKIQDINNTLEKSDAFNILYNQYKYIKESPNDRYFLYTSGWTNLLAPENLDIILIILLLIIITPIFTYEYEKDIVSLILTSKKGKGIVPLHKVIVATIVTIIVTIIFSAIQYVYCNIKYGLPSGGFPLQSVIFFKTSTHNVSLIHTYIYMSLIKVIGFLGFTYLIIFISVITKKTVLTLFTSLSVIYIPYFIYFSTSIKYKLPLPLGFMLASGYFRGNNSGQEVMENYVKFMQISKQEFVLEIVYMIMISTIFIIMVICIFSKFKHRRRKKI